MHTVTEHIHSLAHFLFYEHVHQQNGCDWRLSDAPLAVTDQTQIHIVISD